MRYSTWGEKGVSKVLEIVAKMDIKGEYTREFGAYILIKWHHYTDYSPRQ